MIKANELRLGNWITFLNLIEPEKYVQVTGRFMLSLTKDDYISNYYAPIPISPEILEKAGFIKIEGKQGIYQTVEGQYQIAFFEGRNAVFYIRYDEFRGYCYLNGLLFYVHQLQNLYFALSGEELTITL